MEKNYKVRIERDWKQEPDVIEYFEELGQAMVRVKSYGHEMLQKYKCSLQHSWCIYNYQDEDRQGDLKHALGTFDKEWNPVITDVEYIK